MGNVKRGESGVYKIVCLGNGSIYIGQSANMKRRRSEHFSKLRAGRHANVRLQNAFDKYGEGSISFEPFIYLLIEEDSVLTELEQDAMTTHSEFDMMNLAPIAGCNRGFKFSKEQRERVRASSKKRIQTRTENMMKDWEAYLISPEHQANLEYENSEEHLAWCRQQEIDVARAKSEAKDKRVASLRATIERKRMSKNVERIGA